MRINSVEIRHFRSIGSTTLRNCGGLNILIGKNNAGKSNLLSAIELSLSHFKSGAIAAKWPNRRPAGDFTDNDDSMPIEIGIEFEFPPPLNEELRSKMIAEAAHLEKAIHQIKDVGSMSFVLNAARRDGHYFFFVKNICVGKLQSDAKSIGAVGINLFNLTAPVAFELYSFHEGLGELQKNLEYLDAIESRFESLRAAFEPDRRVRAPLSAYFRGEFLAKPEFVNRIDTLGARAKDADDFRSQFSVVRGQTRDEMERLAEQKTHESMSAFAGEVQTPPNYVMWLVQAYGAIPLLHLRETRIQIGRDEAATLLSLKVRRGGPERLAIIQQTVRDLMGVRVDAFEAEGGGRDRRAEIDVDDFLVEANGSGIREALRLILDLELKSPKLALIEEPESHLHPGLARVMATYLRRKSQDTQLFITTHSTEFIDTESFENAYLVSRAADHKTVCDSMSANDAPLRIPAELGLRLSTVFMYDRLVFVEGPTDEAILSVLASNLSLDLSRSNVGFVHMKGVRNFAHFAAEGTLELLSRRRVKLWFIADRDEKDDAEVRRMVERLAGQATLAVLEKRELENYLVDPKALTVFIGDKMSRQNGVTSTPEATQMREAIEEVAESLKDEVMRLKLEDRMLKPIFLHTRESEGTIEERLRAAVVSLEGRITSLDSEKDQAMRTIEETNKLTLLGLVPGTLLLEGVCKKFGVSYSKARGDGERLARLLTRDRIQTEIQTILTQICGDE